MKYNMKRIFGLLLAALFLISLTGCQPSHFTTQENHDMTDAVTGDVNDWFQKNYPTAMDISYNLHTEYVDTDGDAEKATYSDASPGDPSSAGKNEDDKEHIYVYDMETLRLLRDYDLEEE